MSSLPLLASAESSPRSSRDIEKSPMPLPTAAPPSTKPSPILLRKALIALAAASLLVFGLSRTHIDVNYYSINVFPTYRQTIPIPAVPLKIVDESAPNTALKDSLVEGVKYATAAVGAGFNNQLIGYIMLLQYAREAGRVPILGDFIAASNPNIYSPKAIAPHMPFDTVFDLTAYTAASQQQVTTFSELKLPQSAPETLQCFATNHRTEQHDLHGVSPSRSWGIPWSTAEGVDMDIWNAPVNLDWGRELDVGLLVGFSEDPVRREMAVSQSESEREQAEAQGLVERRQSAAVPDQQLACWSDLYWAVDTDNVFDERWGAWPAWDAVGTHLRFAAPLEALASEYLRKVFGRPRPFIAIHARHGDFGCPTQDTSAPAALGASCYRSPSSYLSTVKSIRGKLARERGVEISPKAVIVFSDETDERWWDEVADMGWKRVDHKLLETEAQRDNWWPTLIDMVLMSQAKGFIGTSGSTYSLLAARRVTDWQQGVVALEDR